MLYEWNSPEGVEELQVHEDVNPSYLLFKATDSDRDRTNLWVPRADVASLRDALSAWLGDTPPIVTDPLTEDRVRAIVQDAVKLTQHYGTGALADQPVPHDCDWGAPCGVCGHVSGVHSGGGCHAMKNGEYCACELDGPGAVNAPKPKVHKLKVVCHQCKEPWSDGHGNSGDPCVGPLHPAETAALDRVQPELSKASCTCHRHHHVITDRFMCGHPGCYCPNASQQVAT